MPNASHNPTGHAEASTPRPLDPSGWLEAYGDRLYNYAFNRLRQHELAEEAVQETLFSAIRSLDTFRGQSSEVTWLFAILKRKILDLLHKSWRSMAKVSLDEEVNPEGLLFDASGHWRADVMRQGGSQLEWNELQEIVWQCLRKLPRSLATIFTMRILQEKKSEEICQELEISESNYWTRMHRARLGLAKCVADKWPVD